MSQVQGGGMVHTSRGSWDLAWCQGVALCSIFGMVGVVALP